MTNSCAPEFLLYRANAASPSRLSYVPSFIKVAEVVVAAYHLTRQSTRTQLRCAGYLIR